RSRTRPGPRPDRRGRRPASSWRRRCGAPARRRARRDTRRRESSWAARAARRSRTPRAATRGSGVLRLWQREQRALERLALALEPRLQQRLDALLQLEQRTLLLQRLARAGEDLLTPRGRVRTAVDLEVRRHDFADARARARLQAREERDAGLVHERVDRARRHDLAPQRVAADLLVVVLAQP